MGKSGPSVALRVLAALLSLFMVWANLPPASAQSAGDLFGDQVLQQSWDAYKKRFIQSDGRVMDLSAGSITTSEGQSYAMLRAAWMDDQKTFDSLWAWTRNNLMTSAQPLFAWKWGQRCDKSWGILDDKSASDADQDIALALIIASSRWGRPQLLSEARELLRKIWATEVIVAGGKAYLSAGNWGPSESKPRLNPSYFAPYAYRLFATVDRGHNWEGLVDTAYDILNQTAALSRLGLPPDWCYLDPATGKVSINRDNPESDYSYDAMRVPFRITLDWLWHPEPRARQYLEKLAFLQDSWREVNTIRAGYTACGVMRGFDEPLAGFACVLPWFQVSAPGMARQVVRERILSRYEDGIWRPDTDYYGQNWAWFALALLKGRLSKPQL